MSVAPCLPHLARSRRGASPPLQATLILAAALFILLALKQLLTGTAAPAAQTGIDKAFRGGDTAAAAAVSPTPTPAPVPGPTPTPAPAPTAPPGVVTPAMAAANKRLDAIREEVDTAYAASYVAYGRAGDDEPEAQAKYDRLLKQLEEKYVAEPVEVPGTGYHGTIFRPRNPGDKAILALAGTDDLRDVVVDGGQLLAAPSTAGALAGVAGGAARGSPGAVASEVVQFGAGTYARGVYDGSLQIAAALVRQYGAENVTVVGHSLGGGMAGYAGAMLGVRAVGFNSAPLGTGSLENVRRFGVPGAEANITNVNAAGEFVSSYSPGRQVGESITVEGRSDGWLAFLWNHSIDNIDTDRGVAYQPAPRSR
jgi:hypothetical protein